MIKNKYKVILSMLVFALCFAQFSFGVTASEPPSATVPVEITLEGTLPSISEIFTVVLTANDESTPMPFGATGGEYKMTMTGASKQNLTPISYSTPGIYLYSIRQLPGTTKDCTYSTDVYHLKVTVSYSETKQALETTTSLRRNDEEAKCSVARFHNKYKTIPPAPSNDPNTPGKKGKNPRTGDSSDFILFAGIAFASIITIILMLFSKRKQYE